MAGASLVAARRSNFYFFFCQERTKIEFLNDGRGVVGGAGGWSGSLGVPFRVDTRCTMMHVFFYALHLARVVTPPPTLQQVVVKGIVLYC